MVFTIYKCDGKHWSCNPDNLYKFPSSAPISFHMKFGSKDSIVLRKTRFHFEIWLTFGQGQRLTLTFDTHEASFTHSEFIGCKNF